MKKMPKGRTLTEFQPLKPGETALLNACANGEVADLGRTRPTEKSEDNTVRASFIRFLALGGDAQAPVHEHGVQLQGAWVEEPLNLTGTVTPSNLSLCDSHFEFTPVLDGAEIVGTLDLSGSFLPGLHADRAVIKGSVFLKNGFNSIGEVRLLGVQIGSSLDCQGAKLDGKDGKSLSADRAIIKGNVFLSIGFSAIGEVRLLGARIGGNLDCHDANLDGKDGDSLSADGMTVGGAFRFCDLMEPAMGVSLASAKVGRLIDDAASWGGELTLDGFVYAHLAGGAPTDAVTRLIWLNKQSAQFTSTEGFRPQPWKQLQTVLRSMGHAEDARQVAIAFEDHLRSAKLIGQTPTEWGAWRRKAYGGVARGAHFLFKKLMGYGYRPLRLGLWMLGVWLLCASMYWCAALQGVMAPSNPLVFQHMPQYESCNPNPTDKGIKPGNWYLCDALPEEYTGFSPLAYSLDVLLPLVNLQQEQDWAPLIPTPKGTWYEEFFTNWSFKHVVRLTVWFEILFGWVASLLLVAVVSGLTKRSEE